jgi:hypothetical protein
MLRCEEKEAQNSVLSQTIRTLFTKRKKKKIIRTLPQTDRLTARAKKISVAAKGSISRNLTMLQLNESSGLLTGALTSGLVCWSSHGVEGSRTARSLCINRDVREVAVSQNKRFGVAGRDGISTVEILLQAGSIGETTSSSIRPTSPSRGGRTKRSHAGTDAWSLHWLE